MLSKPPCLNHCLSSRNLLRQENNKYKFNFRSPYFSLTIFNIFFYVILVPHLIFESICYDAAYFFWLQRLIKEKQQEKERKNRNRS